MATKKTNKRDLKNREIFYFQIALTKISKKASNMAEESIYNEKAKKELLRISKGIRKIVGNLHYRFEK